MAADHSHPVETYDPQEIVRLEADILAFPPWRKQGVVTMSRNALADEVVAAWKATGLNTYDKPNTGLYRVLHLLGELSWLREDSGADVCDATHMRRATTELHVGDYAHVLHGLVLLSVRWGVPVLLVGGASRKRAWNVLHGFMDSDPEPLPAVWKRKLSDKARGSGFAQSDVSTAAIRLHSTLVAAKNFQKDQPSDALVQVAHACQIDYLKHRLVPQITSPASLAAVARLISLLEAATLVREVARPRDRTRQDAEASREQQLEMWSSETGEIVMKLENVVRGRSDSKRSFPEVPRGEMDEILDTVSRRLFLLDLPPDEVRAAWWNQVRHEVDSRRTGQIVTIALVEDWHHPEISHVTTDPEEAIAREARIVGSERFRQAALDNLELYKDRSRAAELADRLLRDSAEILGSKGEVGIMSHAQVMEKISLWLEVHQEPGRPVSVRQLTAALGPAYVAGDLAVTDDFVAEAKPPVSATPIKDWS